jgi:hypothetical protein
MKGCEVMRFANFLLHIIFPVLLGTLIYIIFRDTSLWVFDWIKWLSLDKYVLEMREECACLLPYLHPIVLYALPDALWIYSFLYLMVALWIHEKGKVKWIFISLPILCGIGGELGQFVNLVPGTFDVWDLIVSILASGLALHNITKGGEPTE